jgi:hypothetical protein
VRVSPDDATELDELGSDATKLVMAGIKTLLIK